MAACDVRCVAYVTCFLWAMSAFGYGGRSSRAPGPNMCHVQQVYGTGEKFFTRCVAKHLQMICERPTYVRWDCCSGYEREPGRQGCTRNGLTANEARVVDPDLVATNGVIHGIDKVLLPDSVKEPSDLLEEMYVKKFLELTRKAGLEHRLNNMSDVTIFAPTDQAFARLPHSSQAALTREPLTMDRLLDYHIVKGRLTNDNLTSNLELEPVGLSAKIKVNVFREGVAVDTAEITGPLRNCDKASVQKVSKVLTPPEHTLMDLLNQDRRLSVFRQAVEKSGLSDELSSGGRYTVLAPSDRAFSYLDQRRLDLLMNDSDRLKQLVNRHIINRMVPKCEVPKTGTYGIASRQGDLTVFNYDTRGSLLVNDLIYVRQADRLAVNGVLHRVDDVLKCSCDPSLTRSRRYQRRTRKRRHYTQLRY